MDAQTIAPTASAFQVWATTQDNENFHAWAVTPTHLVEFRGRKKKLAAFVDALEAQDNNAAVTAKGATAIARDQISMIRFLPDTSKAHIHHRDKTKEHMMWPEAFAGIAAANPDVVPQSVDHTSTKQTIARFGGLLAVAVFLGLHYVSHAWTPGPGERVNVFIIVLRDIPTGAAYLLAAIGTALSIGYALWRNSKPTQSWVMQFGR